MLFRALSLAAVFFVVTQAAELTWSASGCPSGYDFCGDLEFCQSGGAYSYRLVGDTACSFPAPLIRMTAGKKYEVIVHNTADYSVITNLHTHGLHISGSGNADDVTREVHGGHCIAYTWDLPSDHIGGTYWYHAHHHGVTQAQVSGGAFGMLIIEDPANLAPTAGIAAWLQNEITVVAAKVGSTVTGNGVDGGNSHSLISGEWYRVRIAAVDPKGTASDIKVTGSCVARKVANDGVWVFNVPRPADTVWSVTGASRLDLALMCTGAGAITFSRSTVASFTIGSGSPTGATPFHNGGTWQPARPGHLQDLRGASIASGNTYSIGMTASQINGQSWDPNVGLGSIAFDAVHEWTLSATGAHPFHLHLYHMQVVSPGGCGAHEEGEFYDVISTNGDCVVRFKSAGVGERCVLHCHVLSHEDGGAMSWVDVVGGPAQDTTYREPFACGGGAPPPAPAPCTPTTCTANFECGSTAGTDNCGGSCTATAGSCSGGSTCSANACVSACTPTTCTADFECGSTAGTDDCGGSCTATAGSCSGGFICSANACVSDGPCTLGQIGDSCTDGTDCCSGSCSGGKPSQRKCQ